MTLAVTCSVTLFFSAYGGLRAILWTDLFQFVLAMGGSVAACLYVVYLPEVGGMEGLMTHPNVAGKLSVWPDFDDPGCGFPSSSFRSPYNGGASYYPGAEPGGGGYIAQRMFGARSEGRRRGHAAVQCGPLRPPPLALDFGRPGFPHRLPRPRQHRELSLSAAADKVGHDVAYPAMLSLLPSGLLGWVTASLLAAFISTMSTQVNLGASYLVNDVWVQFIRPNANEQQKVGAGRWATILSLVAGAALSLTLTSAGQAFSLLLLLGAGTGGLFILRWFWWRISAGTEIAAMVISLVVAIYFTWIHVHWPPEPVALVPALADWVKLVAGSLITTAGWVAAAYLLPRNNQRRCSASPTSFAPAVPAGLVFRAESEEGRPRGTCPGTAAGLPGLFGRVWRLARDGQRPLWPWCGWHGVRGHRRG